MRYYQTWADYSRRPEVKQLIESKGMNFVRQQYQREVNFMQWNDPVIINETNQPGLSVTNPAAQGDNSVGSTQYITGHSAQSSVVAWSAGANNDVTASNVWVEGANFFDIQGILVNGDDWSSGHKNSKYSFRCYLTTGSTGTFDLPENYHGILTSSVEANATTGSLLRSLKDAINTQAASAVVGGVTNGAVAPGTLFTATLAAGSSSLTITNDNNGGVADTYVVYADTTSGSLSVTNTPGLDTYHYKPGVQTFDGHRGPYNNMPRKG